MSEATFDPEPQPGDGPDEHELVASILRKLPDAAFARPGQHNEEVRREASSPPARPAPGTGTPEPGGMTPLELLWACRTVAQEAKLVGDRHGRHDVSRGSPRGYDDSWHRSNPFFDDRRSVRWSNGGGRAHVGERQMGEAPQLGPDRFGRRTGQCAATQR